MPTGLDDPRRGPHPIRGRTGLHDPEGSAPGAPLDAFEREAVVAHLRRLEADLGGRVGPAAIARAVEEIEAGVHLTDAQA